MIRKAVEDRLIEVWDGDVGTGSLTASYYYDPFGRRLWKDVGGTRTYFLYSDEGLVGEYDENGTEIKTYGYKPGSTWTTDPIFIKEGTTYYFYHNDHLGTPQKITAMKGAVVWSAKYSAFGEATVDPASTIANNLRFPGQYFDQETGFHYNLWRYFDAESGRYLRQEPLKDLLIPSDSFILRGLILCGEWDVSLYRYCLNDPINFIDPYGLQSGVPWVFIARVVCSTVCFGKAMYCHKNCATEDEGDCPDLEAKKKCKVKCNIGYVNCMDTCWPQWLEYSPKPELPDTPGSGGGGAGGPFDGSGGFGGGESGGGGGFRSF